MAFCVPIRGLAELGISGPVIESLVGSRNASCLFKNADTYLCLHPAQAPVSHLIGLNTLVGFQVHPFQKTSETDYGSGSALGSWWDLQHP